MDICKITQEHCSFSKKKEKTIRRLIQYMNRAEFSFELFYVGANFPMPTYWVREQNSKSYLPEWWKFLVRSLEKEETIIIVDNLEVNDFWTEFESTYDTDGRKTGIIVSRSLEQLFANTNETSNRKDLLRKAYLLICFITARTVFFFVYFRCTFISYVNRCPHTIYYVALFYNGVYYMCKIIIYRSIRLVLPLVELTCNLSPCEDEYIRVPIPYIRK